MSALICTPAYGGMLTVGYFRSAFNIKNDPRSAGVDFLVTEGESHVTRARNNLVATFLNQTDLDTLVFIDADIEMQADDFFDLLSFDSLSGSDSLSDSTLLSGGGVRGAAVACKTADRSEVLSVWADGRRPSRSDLGTEPRAVDFLGSAVLAIDRTVFERLAASEAVSSYSDPIVGTAWDFFRDGVSGDDWLSEDYGFCALCASEGVPIVCLPGIKVRHYGLSSWCF